MELKKPTQSRILQGAAFLLLMLAFRLNRVAEFGDSFSLLQRTMMVLPSFILSLLCLYFHMSAWWLLIGGLGMILPTVSWAKERIIDKCAAFLTFVAGMLVGPLSGGDLVAICHNTKIIFNSFPPQPPTSPPRSAFAG